MRTEWNTFIKKLRDSSIQELLAREGLNAFPFEVRDQAWQVQSGLEELNAEIDRHRL